MTSYDYTLFICSKFKCWATQIDSRQTAVVPCFECHINKTILTTLNSSSLLTSFVCKQCGGAEITKNKRNVDRSHVLSMTETVLTSGLKEHLPFPDSVLESMWNTCSCRGEKEGNQRVWRQFYMVGYSIWRLPSLINLQERVEQTSR